MARTRTAARRVGTLRPHDLVLRAKRGWFTATAPSQMNTHTVLFPNKRLRYFSPSVEQHCCTQLSIVSVLNPHKLPGFGDGLSSAASCGQDLSAFLSTYTRMLNFFPNRLYFSSGETHLGNQTFYLRFQMQEHGVSDTPPMSPAPWLAYLFISVDAVPLLTGQPCPPFSTLLVFLFLCSYFYLFYFFYFVSIFKGKPFGTVDKRFCSFAFCSNDECFVYYLLCSILSGFTLFLIRVCIRACQCVCVCDY